MEDFDTTAFDVLKRAFDGLLAAVEEQKEYWKGRALAAEMTVIEMNRQMRTSRPNVMADMWDEPACQEEIEFCPIGGMADEAMKAS